MYFKLSLLMLVLLITLIHSRYVREDISQKYGTNRKSIKDLLAGLGLKLGINGYVKNPAGRTISGGIGVGIAGGLGVDSVPEEIIAKQAQAIQVVTSKPVVIFTPPPPPSNYPLRPLPIYDQYSPTQWSNTQELYTGGQVIQDYYARTLCQGEPQSIGYHSIAGHPFTC